MTMNDDRRSGIDITPRAGCGDEGDKGGAKLLDRLMETRTVLISEPVSSDLSEKILPRLLLLEAEDPKAPVKVLINSPGGAVDDGFAIYDMMRYVSCPVTSVCIGLAASAATIILLGGDKGRRVALPNTRILLHQPSQSMRGVASDVEISGNEILRIRARINELLAAECGKKVEEIQTDLNRDFWLSAQQAVEYGLLDKVIETAAEADSL
ncbi:MAG: ATP-dependent Clp protease proteolytic subunit [Planctomycetota bacterium]